MGTPIAFTGEYEGRYVSTTFSRASVAQNLVQNLSSTYQWWNGVDISNQYLIYSDTYSQGQAAYGSSRPTAWTTPDLTDAALLALINTLPDRVGYPGFTDIDIALNWMQGTNKYYLLKSGYENIVTSGLQINFDVAWYNSYSGTTSIFNINTSAGAGSLINGTSFLQYNGGVLNLDGTDDYVTVPSNSAWAIGQNGTIEMWVKREANRTTNHRLWCVFNNSTNLDAYLDGGNTLSMHGGTVGTATASIPLNEWLQIMVTYTDGTIKIYFNGISQTLTGTTTGYNITGTGTLFIGQYSGGGSFYWPGKIANFKLYNRSLNALEVSQNFQAQKSRFGL